MSDQSQANGGFDMDSTEGDAGSSLPSRVQELVDALLAGEISQEDSQSLSFLLKSDPSLRAAYQQQAIVHSMLLWMHGNAEGQNARKVDPLFITERLLESERALREQQQQEALRQAEVAARAFEAHKAAQELERKRLAERAKRASRTVYGACTALAAAVVLLLSLMTTTTDDVATVAPADEAAPNLPDVVARLASSVDAEWAGGRDYLDSQQLIQGEYNLTEGFVKIVYDHGAEIILEAPARFTLQSPSEVILNSGKVVGLCPSLESRNFAVVTPGFRVTDLGTEFGVHVSDDSKALVQVFDGLVELASVADDGQIASDQQITAGLAMEIDVESGETELVVAEPLAFVRGEEFDVREEASDGDALAQWRLQSYELRRDPTMLLYYSFDDESLAANKLVNQAKETAGRHNGSIQKASWAEGRYPGKNALSFVIDEKDRAKNAQYVAVDSSTGDPFDFGKQSFSVGVWFSLQGQLARTAGEGDEAAEDYLPLLTKGYGNWRLQWNIQTQSMVWDINTLPRDRSRNRLSAKPTAVDEDWHFAAAVVKWDARSGRPEHQIYFDGRSEDVQWWGAEGLQSNDQPVTIGYNSARPTAVFSGMIDEVMVFDRALDDSEIKAIYNLTYKASKSIRK